MKQIYIQLLGTPRIQVDGQDVFFTYSKVQALLYYMAMKGVALRDELSGMLWPDKPDMVARKNLRNAIYEAKKVLGSDIFVSPRNAVLAWNQSEDIIVDVQQFEQDPLQCMDLYKGEFLQGFYLKETESYEEWYLYERGRLKSLHMQTVYQLMERSIESKDSALMERYLPLLLAYNPYEEELFAKILHVLMTQGKQEMATHLYEQLVQIYREDMDEAVPTILTKPMEQEYILGVDTQKLMQEMIPKGREEDATHIEAYVQQCNECPQILRITGDHGSGKTSLLRYMKAYVGRERRVIEGQCFLEEAALLLHPWIPVVAELLELVQAKKQSNDISRRIYEVFPQLDRRMSRDLGFLEGADQVPFNVVYKAVSSLIEALDDPVMIIFEDIQWMDSLSLSLLVAISLHHLGPHLMIVVSDVEDKSLAYQRSMSTLQQHQVLHMMRLNPLGPRQMRRIATGLYPTLEGSDALDQLIDVSGGNLLIFYESLDLWREYGSVYGLTEDMEYVYQRKCDPLSKEERKLLDFISLFYNEAPLSMIEAYMGISKLQLLEFLEHLESLWFIDYRTHLGEVWYLLRHYKCKEFLRSQMPVDKWKILHAYLGEAWEKRLTHAKEDMIRYKQLEFHFREAGQYVRALQYKLKAFMHYLNFNKDASPELGVGELSSVYANYFTGRVTRQALQEIEQDLLQVHKLQGDTLAYRSLELPYLYAAGRYYMSIGDANQAIPYFESLIEESQELDMPIETLKAYKELIHYYLQCRDVAAIHRYAKLALDLAVSQQFKKEIGVILRLQALAFIMEGNAEKAIPLLEESIERFSVTQTVARRYGVNIAAAYNYLGDIHKSKFQLKQAYEMYTKALAHCDSTELYSSWVVFASNAGMTAFALEYYEDAERYFTKAYHLCLDNTITRRLPIVEAYLALIHAVKGEAEVAFTMIREAEQHVGIMNHRQEVGHVNVAIFLLHQVYHNQHVQEYFQSPVKTYAGKAISHLDGYRDRWEQQRIKQMLEEMEYDMET